MQPRGRKAGEGHRAPAPGAPTCSPYLGHMQRRGVAVIQPDALEVGGGDLRVLPHVGPQVGAVLRPPPVAQLHAVSPADQLSPEVHVGACRERSSPSPI